MGWSVREDIQITVVIPTYNRSRVIGRAIESALGQEHSPSEVIVIDDGSLDGTRGLIDSYGDSVRYAYQTNAGVSAARNRGVREAHFEWIAFLDSDDYWLPDHLKRMVNAIEATQGRAALYFADTQMSGDGGDYYLWRTSGFEIHRECEFKPDASKWVQRRVQPMMLQSSVISRKAYLEIGGLPEQLRTREDTLLFFKLALLYPACAVSGCGTIMNSDGDFRLTQLYNAGSLVFWDASILVYKELLASVRNCSSESRRFLRTSLGASYFALCRIFFRHKKYLSAIKNAAASFGVSPPAFVKELSDSLARRVFRVGGVESDSPTCGTLGRQSATTSSQNGLDNGGSTTLKG